MRKVHPLVWPVGAFVLTFALHFLATGLFPEQDPAQGGWLVLPVKRSWLDIYLENQGYWMGYTYALSAALAAEAVRRYLTGPSCRSGGIALGSVTLSGVLAAAGCFLIGCCGSPMLIVWMNLLGARFLPFARPAMAGLTTLTVAGAWWWMYRKGEPSQQTSCHNRLSCMPD